MKRSTSLLAPLVGATLLLGACAGDDDEQGLSIDSSTPQEDTDSGDDTSTVCIHDDGSISINGSATDIDIDADFDIDDDGDLSIDSADGSVVVNGHEIEVSTHDGGRTIVIDGNGFPLDDLGAC